jgi:hypothetical protein
MQEITMSSSTEVRNQIGPLLDRLIIQLDDEGSATQCAYFARIRRSLYRARHDWDLATPIRELSTTSAVGFTFSSDADALMARILEKAGALADELDQAPTRPH